MKKRKITRPRFYLGRPVDNSVVARITALENRAQAQDAMLAGLEQLTAELQEKGLQLSDDALAKFGEIVNRLGPVVEA